MKNLGILEVKAGNTVIYNDGREGHKNVQGIVKSVSDNIAMIKFSDRASVSTVALNNPEWTNFLTVLK